MNCRMIFFVASSAALLTGGMLVSAQTQEAKQPDKRSSAAQAKLAAVREVLDIVERQGKAGLGTEAFDVEFQHTWSVRLMEAERDLAADAATRRQAMVRHLEHMQAQAKRTEELYRGGHVSKVEALACAYFAAEAEAWLGQAERSQ